MHVEKIEVESIELKRLSVDNLLAAANEDQCLVALGCGGTFYLML